LRYGRISDSVAILVVTIVAVFTNLAIAIAAGILLSALVHAWDSGAHVEADIQTKDMVINGKRVEGVKYVHVRGAIFFSSTRKFVNMFHIADDPETMILDFKDALIIDHSAVAAIQGLTHRYALAGKRVILFNIQPKCVGRMNRTHGNPKQLLQQMSNTIENAEVGGPTTIEEEEIEKPHSLQQLKMFSTDIDGHEAELKMLGLSETRYSVEAIDEKKKS
jgi:MFS superfamily sulfate permease-like transporter